MLLTILNKLDNVDVLYSLKGVNQKFDRLARSIDFTQPLDLTTISSYEDDYSKIKSMFDRLCFYILPQIQHNVQCLTLDPWSMISVLSIGNYPKLHKLTLIHHKVEIADRIFCKLDGLPSECYSSIIVYLNLKVKTFNDCLWLLNGHLSQLHTLVVHVEYIHNTSKIINNKVYVSDVMHSIEYDFFVRISQAFPLLEGLTVLSTVNQQKPTNELDEHEQTFSIIKYSHLMTLDLISSHIDYSKQFLLKTSLPRLSTLGIDYEHLVNITEDFTNNTARANCANLKNIIF
ncbi:unnamed protein product, partial [Rotaria sordida]